MYVRKRQSGFTIVELLIVIVVIGILASITVVAFNGIQERARVSQANSDLSNFVKAIHVARINEGKVLKDITGSGCTRCSTDPARYALTIDNIATASGTNLNGIKAGDPWGNPYFLDENEGEFATCTRDGLGVVNASTHPGLVIPIIPTYAC